VSRTVFAVVVLVLLATAVYYAGGRELLAVLERR
jgi:hypothetical protein